jgi:hypothetical protein
VQIVSFVGAVIISGCVLCAAPAAGGSANAQTAPAGPPHQPHRPRPTALPRGRVYLFRGALGLIFSRGWTSWLNVSKRPVCQWTSMNLRFVPTLRSGPFASTARIPRHHSHRALNGGFCALQFAEKLRAENIPVSLIVTIDPAHLMPKLPMNVERYMNIFLARDVLGGGDVVPEKGYQGHFASFDLSKLKGVLHINIDKMDIIHTQLLTKICRSRDAGQARRRGRAHPLCCPARCRGRFVGQRHAGCC